MKTNSTALSSPLHTIPSPSRLSGLGKTMLGTVCVSLCSFAAIPQAQAGKVDGTYEVTRTTGSIEFDGDDINIPDSMVRRIVNVVDGEITIQDRTLQLKKKGAVRIVKDFADDLDVDVEARVSGPSSLTLEKKGDIAKGRTTRPIVTSFEAEIFDEDFSGELITRVSATVENKTLTIVVRFSGDALGSDFSGRVTIVAKR
ncbi:MAG: hypothetical protein V4640_08595 [Verrucomicrobiota bacterium]